MARSFACTSAFAGGTDVVVTPLALGFAGAALVCAVVAVREVAAVAVAAVATVVAADGATSCFALVTDDLSLAELDAQAASVDARITQNDVAAL